MPRERLMPASIVLERIPVGGIGKPTGVSMPRSRLWYVMLACQASVLCAALVADSMGWREHGRARRVGGRRGAHTTGWHAVGAP
jgi:hypothetical protein